MKNDKTQININNTTLKVAMQQAPSEQEVVFNLASTPGLRRPYGRYGKRRNKRRASIHSTKSAPSPSLSSSQAQGQAFEQRAISFLQTKGLRLIAKNLRCKAGEIDCVMLDKSTLVFVEVRQRSHRHISNAAASITKEKQRKIKLAANYFLPKLHQHLGLNEPPYCRFDVVTYDGEEQSHQWFINAFY